MRIRTLIHASALALWCIPLCICCGQRASLVSTPQQFAEYFINPSPQRADSLEKASVSPAAWDSIAAKAAVADSGAAGSFTEVLTDSCATAYTLGWSTPARIRRDTVYPLIIYLHGGIGSPLSTKGEHAWEMLKPLGDSMQLFLASPSGNRFSPWWSPEGLSRIMQALRFMSMHYPIDPDKVFLAGVSDGATGCYAAANIIGAPFAGFFAISGFGGMLPQMGIALFPSNLARRPIYNVNAGRDRIYSLADVDKFLDWLNGSGVGVLRKTYPDELHGFDYRAREFGALAGFIRTWSRPKTMEINWSFLPGFPWMVENLVDWKPDASMEIPRLRALWNGDTLEIASTGIAEITVNFSGVNAQRVFARANGGGPKEIAAMRPDAALLYREMVAGGFPKVSTSSCYRIKIPK